MEWRILGKDGDQVISHILIKQDVNVGGSRENLKDLFQSSILKS